MTIQLDHGAFGRGASEVRAEAAELDATLTRLTARVEALLDDWHGAAASSYAEAWADWRGGAHEVGAALASMAETLAAFHADLGETDAVAADRAQRLRARLR